MINIWGKVTDDSYALCDSTTAEVVVRYRLVWSARWVALVVLVLGPAMFLAIVTSRPAPNVAIGCDAFGYLRQAQLFRNNGVFAGLDTALSSDDARFLLNAAKSTGLPSSAWDQAVAPHCHRYVPATDAVRLQYPPGTGMALSMFSPEHAPDHLNIVAACLVALCFAFSAVAGLSWFVVLSGICILLTTAVVMIAPDFNASFSVPLSLGLIAPLALLAQFAFPPGTWRHFMLAAACGVLCGALVTVRLTNIFIGLGLALFVLLQACAFPGAYWRRVWPALASATIGFLVGVAPLMWANFVNAGSPFATTYSSTDASPARLSATLAWDNILFYTSGSFAWLFVVVALVALVGAGMAAAISAKADRRPWLTAVFAGAAGTLVPTLAYFLTHDVKGSYYLLPSCFFAVCFCFFGLTIWRSSRGQNHFGMVLTAMAAVCLVGAFRLWHAPVSVPSVVAPAEILSRDVIVWADVSAGTLVYYTGKYAAKLLFADQCTQDVLLRAVARDRKQYLIDDSPTMHEQIERISRSFVVERAGTFHAYKALPFYSVQIGLEGRDRSC